MHPQSPWGTQLCLPPPPGSGCGVHAGSVHKPPCERVHRAHPHLCAENTELPRLLAALTADLIGHCQGGEVHVSGGSCLFIIVVALKWNRQGNTWSHFCRELHKQQRLLGVSGSISDRENTHRMVKGCERNTTKHTGAHTYTHTKTKAKLKVPGG